MFSTVLLQLIVFFLPTQLGLHFWPDLARAAGIKVDYLSPTLYFLDILIFLYLSANIFTIIKWFKKNFYFLSLFAFLVFLNTYFSISPHNTLFWWLRWILYLLFFLTLRLNKVTWKQIQKPLLLSVVLIVLVETFQMFFQSSLGGPFYWLGERAFSSSTPGLGRLSLFGRDFLRPMSTFSHANSLSGYLLVVALLLKIKKSPFWQRFIVFIGILLTFSKGGLLTYLLIILLPLNSTGFISFFLVASLLQILFISLTSQLQFLSDRLFLLAPSRQMLFESPLFGVGLGGFIPSLSQILLGSHLLPEKLQPVHNLPLLFLSELGLVGVIALVWLFKKHWQKIRKPALLSLIALIVITGAFDHYWWTLPQNKLVLLLGLAILL